MSGKTISENDFFAGVDVGNYDTKTPSTSFLSGYTVSTNKPFGVAEDYYLVFEGTYYVLSQQRFPYVQDKTVDEKMFILTLFGIAKEMETVFSKRFEETAHPKNHVKQAIADTTTVHLGVGLPPAHLAAQNERTVSYYKEMFGKGVKFTYNGNDYDLKLGEIEVYPQNFAVIAADGRRNPDSIMAQYPDFYTLDFGGFTLDKIAITNRKLDLAQCDSLEDGIVTFCDSVIAQVRRNRGVTIDEKSILNVLTGVRTIFDDETIALIKSLAESWTHSVLDKIQQTGANFKTRPVVFMGGTSILLKEYIATYPGLLKYEILENVNANAEAYRKLIKYTVTSKQK